jgi:hypothetical protein
MPGERFVYFTGAGAHPIAAGGGRGAQARGKPARSCSCRSAKGPGVRDYIMLKRRNAEPPQPLSRAGVELRPPGTRVDEEIEDLMAVLRRLAALGVECPTNAKLADLASLKDAESARYRLGLLEQQGRINVRTPPEGARVITIIASGLTTAAGGAVSGKR